VISNVKIRPATPDDVPRILAVEQNTPAAAHWSEEQYRAMFHAESPQELMLIAEDENAVLGFLVARRIESEWELENIAVITEGRRCGLGTALVGELSKCARLSGATSLILEVRESNAAARALYEKSGFLQEGRRKNYYRTPEEDAVLYRLPLQ
jgi:ribosomal-protein-alanine acetyltransferase